MKNKLILILALAIFIASCTKKEVPKTTAFIQDKPFVQDYSIKYLNEDASTGLLKVASDRNGYVQILSSKGLLRTRDGQFLFPGTLVKDIQDRSTSDKKISGIGTYQNQLVYIDNKAVLSNAWAGKLYSRHTMPEAKIFCGGKDFAFLISDGKNLSLSQDSKDLWKGSLSGDEVKDIKFDASANLFWILGKSSVSTFSPENKEVSKVFDNENITCFELATGKVLVGTTDGYFEIDSKTKKQIGDVHRKMPWTELTAISNIDGKIWFGSTWGAMMLREDGKFSYYASKRWIPSDTVVHIAEGPENSVLILTNNGLGNIRFKELTLAEKADYFEKQVRDRHIRTGFNATVSRMVNGDVTTGSLENSDNDGLWTSMYLAGETFR